MIFSLERIAGGLAAPMFGRAELGLGFREFYPWLCPCPMYSNVRSITS